MPRRTARNGTKFGMKTIGGTAACTVRAQKGAIADGSVPDDGHGNRWTHKWGEEWDGHGGCAKWTDSFADRDVSEDGGTGRAWGEKWEERWGGFAHNGSAGNRSGTTWNDRDGHKFEKTWGEEHWHDGRVHKWGSTTDGSDGWDTWEDSQGWWERAPSFGWDEAVSHSPQLLSVPLRPRAPGGSGDDSGKKKTVGRPPGRTIKPTRESASQSWSVMSPSARARASRARIPLI